MVLPACSLEEEDGRTRARFDRSLRWTGDAESLKLYKPVRPLSSLAQPWTTTCTWTAICRNACARRRGRAREPRRRHRPAVRRRGNEWLQHPGSPAGGASKQLAPWQSSTGGSRDRKALGQTGAIMAIDATATVNCSRAAAAAAAAASLLAVFSPIRLLLPRLDGPKAPFQSFGSGI
ncbi:hypothetical protein GQ55_1G052300 [Panicum hallii var. hallii]|uniref:Uncharacterized protein n=1 Tax=Panicum hallii var. hallii TaxID=1504633 RepID=A0A2T7F2H2_9POAL|nr:hypothetical protein GQ55_1G052300 [Panicum hallii var. hallii]